MRPEVFHVAFTNFPIDRVHSRSVNSDQNFIGLWLRTRRVFVLQDFRSAVVVNSNAFMVCDVALADFLWLRCCDSCDGSLRWVGQAHKRTFLSA